MADEYKRLNDEYTRTEEDFQTVANNLKCTEQKLQETVLRLNAEMPVSVKTSETNDRLEDECKCLRRNFRNTLEILHTTEQKLQDTRLELEGATGMYQEFDEAFTTERHSFERDENSDRLLKDKSAYVFAR